MIITSRRGATAENISPHHDGGERLETGTAGPHERSNPSTDMTEAIVALADTAEVDAVIAAGGRPFPAWHDLTTFKFAQEPSKADCWLAEAFNLSVERNWDCVTVEPPRRRSVRK